MAGETSTAYDALGTTEKATRLRQQFQAYYRQLAEEAEPELRGSDQGVWLELMEAEHTNLRAALEWSIENGDTEHARRMVLALERFWWRHPSDGLRFLDRVNEAMTEASSERATALAHAAWLAAETGADGAGQRVESAVAEAQLVGAPSEIARALIAASAFEYGRWRYADARVAAEGALEQARASGRQDLVARAVHWLGRAIAVETTHPAARKLFEEALEIDRSLGDVAMIAADLYPLVLALPPGDERDAAQAEAIRLGRETDDRQRLCEALDAVGWAAFFGEGLPAARAAWEEALEVARSMVEPVELGYYLTIAGVSARYAGDLDVARGLFEEVRDRDRPTNAWALAELAFLELQCGDSGAALRAAEKAVVRARSTAPGDASGLLALGAVLFVRGDDDDATAALEEAFEVATVGGHSAMIGSSSLSLGMAAARRGDLDIARKWVERVPDGQDGERTMHLAALALREGDVNEASRLYREVLAVASDRGGRRIVSWLFEGLADVAVARGDDRRAASLLGAAERARADFGCVREGWWFAGNLHYLSVDDHIQREKRLRESLGTDAFDTAWEAGRSLAEPDAVEYALSSQ